VNFTKKNILELSDIFNNHQSQNNFKFEDTYLHQLIEKLNKNEKLNRTARRNRK